MATIQKYVYDTMTENNTNNFYFIIVVDHNYLKDGNKSILQLDFLRGNNYTNYLLINYDASYKYKSRIAQLHLLFIDAKNNKDFNIKKCKDFKLISSVKHSYKKSLTEIKKEFKNPCKTPQFNKDAEILIKKFADLQNETLQAYKDKFLTPTNYNKYKSFFDALSYYKQRKKDLILFLLCRSLYTMKDDQAKQFLHDTKTFNDKEILICLNQVLKASKTTLFTYNKLNVMTHLRMINNKWKRREIYAKLYNILYVNNLDKFKDAKTAKAETIKQLPQKVKDAKELLIILEKATN